MMRTNIRRILKAGFINFWRNGLISVASIFVITVSLFIIGSIVMARALLVSSLDEIQDKVDINVYLKASASEPEIETLRKEISDLPAVRSIDYVSREAALAQFREKNKDNAKIIDALDELGENPFGAAFNLKAYQLGQYESIAKYLNTQNDEILQAGKESIIDEITYREDTETKVVVERLGRIIDSLSKLGLAISIILAIMAALVTLNTIRLAIYNMRQEIYVMRLVGAGNSFIRGPFIVEGIMYGVVAAVIALVLLYPASVWVSKTTAGLYGGIDLLDYFFGNTLELFLLLLSAGIVLGMISSLIAVRRYLK